MLRPQEFPEAFDRLLGQDAVTEAEQIIAQFQRNRAAGRGIVPPPETEGGDA